VKPAPVCHLPAHAGLLSLRLCGNDLSHLPPAIAGASWLRKLGLDNNPLQLSLDDLEGVLARLPCLRKLDLGLPENATPACVLRALRRHLPQEVVWGQPAVLVPSWHHACWGS